MENQDEYGVKYGGDQSETTWEPSEPRGCGKRSAYNKGSEDGLPESDDCGMGHWSRWGGAWQTLCRSNLSIKVVFVRWEMPVGLPVYSRYLPPGPASLLGLARLSQESYIGRSPSTLL